MVLRLQALQTIVVYIATLFSIHEAVVANKQHDAMVRSSTGTDSMKLLHSTAFLHKVGQVEKSDSASTKSLREMWHPQARVRYDDEVGVTISHRVPSASDDKGRPMKTRDMTIGQRLRQARGRELQGIVIFSVAFLLLLGWGARLLLWLYLRFATAHRKVDDLDWDFNDYIRYVFGTWIAWTSQAGLQLLLFVALLALMVGTFMYWAMVPSVGIWKSSWLTFIWLAAPDAGIGERTWWGALCGGVMSVCGLLIFAILLTLLSEAFFNYMKDLREGNEAVMEVGHIVIVGLTQTRMHLLHELCEAYSEQGGVSIVILLRGTPRDEMQSMIEESDLDLKGSKIILRSGYPQYDNDLDRVGVNACRCVIVLADHREEKEMRDAFVLQALLVLRSKGWPKEGNILLECSLLKNRKTFEEIGGECTHIVMIDRWLSRQMTQVSQQHGLGDIIQQTFTCTGNTMHIIPMPKELIGHNFCDLPWHFSKAIPLGTIAKESGHTILGHAYDRCITEDEDLVLLGKNRNDCLDYNVNEFCSIEPMRGRDRAVTLMRVSAVPETIIIVGWGALMGPFLIQLDIEVCSGTRLIIVSPKSEEARKEQISRFERRWQHKLEHVQIENVVGMLGSPTVWDRLPVGIEDASRIFLLPDVTAADARHADACTIAAIVQLRALIAEKKIYRRIPIVPEIQDPRTELLCKICNTSSFVNSSGMPVQVMASVCVQPRIRLALRQLVGADDPVGYAIRDLGDYLPPDEEIPKQVSFMQCQSLVNHAGDILAGWSWPDPAPSTARRQMQDLLSGVEDPVSWEINPEDKTSVREWNCADRLCVLGLR